MEDAELSDDAREERHPEGAEDRAADVHAHDAAAFGRVEAEALGNDGDVRLAVNRVAGADRLTLHTENERNRKTEDERAEEVPELLHDEGEARIHDHADVGADVEADLRDEDQHADRKHLARAVHFGELDEVPPREARNRAEHERIKERQKHDESELQYADPLRYQHDDECEKVNFVVADEIHDVSRMG